MCGAFGKRGISFAQRGVKVEVLSDRLLPEDVTKAVTGAAQKRWRNAARRHRDRRAVKCRRW